MKAGRLILALAVVSAIATNGWGQASRLDSTHSTNSEQASSPQVSLGQADANAAGRTIVEGENRFALSLYGTLQTEKGNLFFSPYSVSTALAMVYAGARGQTQEQMAKTLCYPAMSGDVNEARFHSAFGQIIKDLNAGGSKGAYELAVANALWGQKGYSFLKEYLSLVGADYGGGLNEVDFVGQTEAARETINKWVEQKTKDKIKELIGKGVIDSSTRLVLTNAIYFKGKWANQFRSERTRDESFNLVSGEKAEVPMMGQTEKFGYMEAEDFQGLELPYVNDELSMVILLPRKVDGISDFEKKLNFQNLSQWIGELHKQKVVVTIPRFKMTQQFSLADTLHSMGMTDAFSGGKADFSGMTGKRDLFISAVVHKAYVEVNEEGTEAAAATGVGMAMSAAPHREMVPVFRADRPFIFLIRDNSSGGILFIGRVMNPK